MQMIAFLQGADIPRAGRVDFASMSQQTLMELLVGDIHNLSNLQNTEGEFRDISSWEGVGIVGNDGRVEGISICGDIGFSLFGDEDDMGADKASIGPGGSIDFKWLPSSVKEIEICYMHLYGTMDTRLLPQNLNDLDVGSNNLSGTFAIEGLPESMEYVTIVSNNFEGTLNIGALPRKMRFISAERNKFHGTLDFSDLPPNMTTMLFAQNDFVGPISLANLPRHMKSLNVECAGIQQDRLVIRVPVAGLHHFRVLKKNFGSIVDVNGMDISADL